jgi:hypothetical protein
MRFDQTVRGAHFYDRQLPALLAELPGLVRELARLNANVERLSALIERASTSPKEPT